MLAASGSFQVSVQTCLWAEYLKYRFILFFSLKGNKLSKKKNIEETRRRGEKNEGRKG